MDKLFRSSLLNAPITINRIQCQVIAQVTTLTGVNRYISYVVAKEVLNDNYYILQVNINGTIVPAHPKYLEIICATLQGIKFPKEPNLDLQVNYRSISRLTKITPCKLSSNVTAVLGPSSDLQQYLRVEIKLGNLSGQLSSFKDFIFYAFDGGNSHLNISFLLEDLFEQKSWHYSSGLRVIIDNHVEGEYFPVDIQVTNEKVLISCQTDLFHALNSSRMGKTELRNLSIYESLDFLVSCAGFPNAVAFPAGYVPHQSWYTVAIPIFGITVAEEIGIGITQYYPKGHTEISRLIATDPVWEQFDTIAILQLNANSLYEAYTKGKKQIEQSLDFAINLLKDDMQIMRRIAFNRYKEKSRKKRVPSQLTLSLEELQTSLSSGKTVEEEYDAKVLGELITEYVRNLSDRQQYIFVDRYYMAEPVEKIASDLSISSVRTVYREIEKIKQGLKEYLEGNGVYV